MLSGLAKRQHTTTHQIITTGVTSNYFLSTVVPKGQTVCVCACVRVV